MIILVIHRYNQAVYGPNTQNMIKTVINTNPESALLSEFHGHSAFDNFFRNWNVSMRLAVGNESMLSNLEDYTGIGS